MHGRMLTAVSVLIATAVGSGAAVQVPVDFAGIDDAFVMGKQASDTERARFHAGYRVIAAKAPVDFVEVVSPFRRIVIEAQQRAAAGDRSFGQRQALEMLARAGSMIDVYVEMTFHPQNMMVGVPDYRVAVIDRRGARIEALSIDRLSRWTPRIDGLPAAVAPGGDSSARGRPLLGATVIARFDLEKVNPERSYELVVEERDEEMARVGLDLARMR